MVQSQSNLDSFFGSVNKVKKQKTLTSFFNKENSSNSNDDEKRAEVAKQATQTDSKARKRRAILDDSDDEQDDEKKPVSPPKDAMVQDDVDTKPAAVGSVAKEETKTTSDQVITNSTDKEDTPESIPLPKALSKLHAQADKLVKLAKVDTNENLETISSPVKYEDLVTVFEKIESISGRLEIQGLMTVLLRRILRDAPEDLYHAVYLASNSIAPAYECLELGIGDSILQKAIGEAYGTKACRCPLLNIRRLWSITITDAHLIHPLFA